MNDVLGICRVIIVNLTQRNVETFRVLHIFLLLDVLLVIHVLHC